MYCIMYYMKHAASFDVGEPFRLGYCGGSPNRATLNWQENGDQAITLPYFSVPYFSNNMCMTAKGTYIIGDHCRGNVGVDRFQQWNLRGHAI